MSETSTKTYPTAAELRNALAAMTWRDLAIEMSPSHADQIRDNGWRWPFYEPVGTADEVKAALALLATDRAARDPRLTDTPGVSEPRPDATIARLHSELATRDATIARLSAKLAEAREALAPFAESAVYLDTHVPDAPDSGEMSSGIGKFRRARAVLAKLAATKEP